MKSELEIRKQLEEVYEHRLLLRVERKMRKICRNCKFGINKEFDLGDFGTMARWECRYGKNCFSCTDFICVNTQEDIEKEMIEDISDPSICGAKEPKIAMLLWVLHDKSKKE
jgi:hypothetical protein